jgi:molybdopterin synthase catalytic subunit
LPAAERYPVFRISDKPLDPGQLRLALRDDGAGAFASFEGRVRNVNLNRPVVRLEYEAYAALAEKEGERILAEARAKFPILDASCAHRTGTLEPGDLAVWVGVLAGHRNAAFDACRYVIDELKTRLPAWKREHYADGSSEWIHAATGRPRQ